VPTRERIEAISFEGARAEIDAAAMARVAAGQRATLAALAAPDPVYGVGTGGPASGLAAAAALADAVPPVVEDRPLGPDVDAVVGLLEGFDTLSGASTPAKEPL